MATRDQRFLRRRHDVFQAIGDPTRRRLVVLLGHGEQPVNHLASRFAMTRPAISQHLRVLRQAKLVSVRRVGRERRYRLRAQPLRDVYEWVAYFERFWTKGLKSLGNISTGKRGSKRGRARPSAMRRKHERQIPDHRDHRRRDRDLSLGRGDPQ